tara:strand:+ start:5777 stop:6061 length:285 start_codon:yes stop_codon:yes gene_type:complete
MTTVRIVPPEHVEILREYLSEDNTILVYPEAQAKATELGLVDGKSNSQEIEAIGIAIDSYDAWNEPDRAVEIVSTPDHHFLDMVSNAIENKTTN